jgi:hypothetical protein
VLLRAERWRWISDEPQPGWIEVEFTDADDHQWIVADKPPIFFTEPEWNRANDQPHVVSINCEVIKDVATSPVVSVKLKWGVESIPEGVSTFCVRRDQLHQDGPVTPPAAAP